MHAHARVIVATIAALWINGLSADGSGTGANSWIGYVFGGNQATGSGSAVTAGTFNLASGQGAFVGAGTANQATGISSLVIGGFDNRAIAIDSLVGAGAGHRASGLRSVIVGGGYNLANGDFSVIVGGGRDGVGNTAAGTAPVLDNRTYSKWTFVGGGHGNSAGVINQQLLNRNAVVVGGHENTASGMNSFIGGGGCNIASGRGSVVAGGGQFDDTGCAPSNINNASGEASFIGGGWGNTASGDESIIAGGTINVASGEDSTVGGGTRNIASGLYSTVPGGTYNTASGTGSFAAGYRAKALANGSFVFADRTEADLTSDVANQFLVAASGGILMLTSKTTGSGCYMVAGGGTWNCTSDRNTKRDVMQIDPQAILRKVATLPLSVWRYEGEASGTRHIGPMAQDFREAFGLGHDDRTISMVDSDGVALAAIQGLHQLVQEKAAQIAALKALMEARIEAQQQAIAELRRAVELSSAATKRKARWAVRNAPPS